MWQKTVNSCVCELGQFSFLHLRSTCSVEMHGTGRLQARQLLSPNQQCHSETIIQLPHPFYIHNALHNQMLLCLCQLPVSNVVKHINRKVKVSEGIRHTDKDKVRFFTKKKQHLLQFTNINNNNNKRPLPALSYGVTGKVGVVTSTPCKKNHTQPTDI